MEQLAAFQDARWRSGSLRRKAHDLGRQASERINHLKAAGAADIEVGILFICEVGVFAYESMDVQDINVTSRHG
jgi:hypothetical protein